MIDVNTKLYGVFGDPVGHSLSPLMHNAALRYLGLNAVYLAFQVQDLPRAMDGVRALGISGLSITIPHKIAVIPYLDCLTPLAQHIGAVNTVIYRSGILEGDNTDSQGAMLALREKTDLAGKRVGLIGAGGAARAIAFGLIQAGASVTVLNRSADKGQHLAEAVRGTFAPLDQSAELECDILINTTPLGMFPHTNKSPVPSSAFKPGMVVMDIVYKPLMTLFLQQAQAQGCDIVDGLSMFVYQGAFQFSAWTGLEAPRQIMRETVLSAL